MTKSALTDLMNEVVSLPDDLAPHVVAGSLVAVHGFDAALWRADLLSACYAKHSNHACAEAWQRVAEAIRQAQGGWGMQDRKSVGEGKGGSVRGELGWRRIIEKKNKEEKETR